MTLQERYTSHEQVKIGAGDAGGNLEEEIIGNHGFNIANAMIRCNW